jgi:hypothetical protein
MSMLVTCYMLVSCLAYSSTRKMEVTCFSETSVDFNGLQKIELLLIFLLHHANIQSVIVSSPLRSEVPAEVITAVSGMWCHSVW